MVDWRSFGDEGSLDDGPTLDPEKIALTLVEATQGVLVTLGENGTIVEGNRRSAELC